MRTSIVAGALAFAGLFIIPVASAAIVYDDRAAFLGNLGASITDDYSAPGYAVGDIATTVYGASHTDSHMNAVLGETRYVSTGFPDPVNFTGRVTPYNLQGFCSGCNGSFLLDFTATSVGTSSGVYGVGLDFNNLGYNDTSFVAFVTFGDGSTANYALPVTNPATFPFFGLTNEALIRSIHFGLADGGTTQSGAFAIDNLTIGEKGTPVPEPGTVGLFALALFAAVLRVRRTPIRAAFRRGDC